MVSPLDPGPHRIRVQIAIARQILADHLPAVTDQVHLQLRQFRGQGLAHARLDQEQHPTASLDQLRRDTDGDVGRSPTDIPRDVFAIHLVFIGDARLQTGIRITDVWMGDGGQGIPGCRSDLADFTAGHLDIDAIRLLIPGEGDRRRGLIHVDSDENLIAVQGKRRHGQQAGEHQGKEGIIHINSLQKMEWNRPGSPDGQQRRPGHTQRPCRK